MVMSSAVASVISGIFLLLLLLLLLLGWLVAREARRSSRVLAEAVSRSGTARDNRVRITTLHPGLLGYLRASPCWRCIGRAQPGLIVGPRSKMRAKQTSPRGLQLGTYEYQC